MKKSILFIAILMLSFLAVGLVDAQVTDTTAAETEIVLDGDFSAPFASLAALAGLIIGVTQLLKRQVFGDLDKKFAQFISWGVGIVLAWIGYAFNLGVFVGLEWYWVFGYGIAATLIANGLFSYEMVKAILKMFGKSTTVKNGTAIMLAFILMSCGTYTPPEKAGIELTTGVVKTTFNIIENSFAAIDKTKSEFEIAADLMPDVLKVANAVNDFEALKKEIAELDDEEVTYLASLSADYNFPSHKQLITNVVKMILYSLQTKLLYSNSNTQTNIDEEKGVMVFRFVSPNGAVAVLPKEFVIKRLDRKVNY